MDDVRILPLDSRTVTPDACLSWPHVLPLLLNKMVSAVPELQWCLCLLGGVHWRQEKIRGQTGTPLKLFLVISLERKSVFRDVRIKANLDLMSPFYII